MKITRMSGLDGPAGGWGTDPECLRQRQQHDHQHDVRRRGCNVRSGSAPPVRPPRQRGRRRSAASSAAGGGDTTFEGAGFTCAEGELRSSGSTAQGKVMEQWIADFNALCGANLNAYGGGGSGKGIAGLPRQPGRLRRLGLRAEGGPGGDRQGGPLRRQRRARTCRWSPARSRWPTTSPASTASP